LTSRRFARSDLRRASASAEALQKVTSYADEVVCLATPAGFCTVGQFYRDFRQVDDDEVIELLRSPVTMNEPPANAQPSR